MPRVETYFMEHDGESYGTFFRATSVLHDSHSNYQRITVFETAELGRVLKLNEVFNVSTLMEAYYHEPMAHIPVGLLGGAERVMIVGGGDFALAGHILKHSSVRKLTLCEIDDKVIRVCRKYFPQWAVVEKDPRFELIIADGIEYLHSTVPESYDLIIVDSTDAFDDSTASVLTSVDFYSIASSILRERGLLIQIAADTIFYCNFWRVLIDNAQSFFQSFAPVFVPIPFYGTGSWGLLLLGKGGVLLDPQNISDAYLDSIPGLRTMTRENIIGWFSLPPCVKAIVLGENQKDKR